MARENLSEQIDLQKLPSGPRVLARLSSLVHRPGIDLAEIAELFRADPALTARIIAACNSAFYSPEARITEFRQALLHLGFRELVRLVEIATITDLRRHPTHLYAQTADHFWERSLHTAFVMDELSGRDPFAYTAGIMHLVGVWVLCTLTPTHTTSIAARELALQAQLEQLRLGVSFAEAGAAALAKWGFPFAICTAVNRQLTPSLCRDPHHRALAILLSRAIAITDWHYGAKNEKSLIRSDLTLTDLEHCNARAARQTAKIGFGF